MFDNKRFAELSNELLEKNYDNKSAMSKLGSEFRTRPHTCMLGTKRRTRYKRRHTELAVALARLAGVTPVVIGAEMLQPNGDAALSVDDAKKWAKREVFYSLQVTKLNKFSIKRGEELKESLR